MVKMILLLPALLLAGCSTQMSSEQIAAYNTPTLTLECDTGCSASYTDPRDRPSAPTNGYDVANNAINAVSGIATSVAPWAALTMTGLDAIKGAGSTDNSVRTQDSTHTPTVVEAPDPVVIEPSVVRPEIVQSRSAAE